MTYPNEIQAFYYETLGWCGCGNPEEALGFMRDVLALLKARSEESTWAKRTAEIEAILPGPLGLSYLYMLDALKLTEHGGSIGGCWLTPKGERVLSMLGADIEAAMDEDDFV